MIYRFFIFLIAIMMIVYYILVVLQLCDVVKFTCNKINCKKLFIPFYYFIKNKKL